MVLAALLLCLGAGCAVFRAADYHLPAVRLDRPVNVPLPASDAPEVRAALARWHELSSSERAQYPTPLHVYAETPAPGTFEGRHTIGLAFSGGGTRGTVFGAACLRELAALGPMAVGAGGNSREIHLLDETGYISGVSTGAIPAALLALHLGGAAPPGFELEHWPACFNRDVIGRALGAIARRPHWVLRDYLAGMNTRPAMAGALAEAFFGGRAGRPASGLRFSDLPPRPVLLIGAAVINDPGAPFIFSRLPYRYTLDERHAVPWVPGIQSFESFGSDPMRYPLAMACHDSLSYPGSMRSGLLRVHPTPDWVLDGLGPGERARMLRAVSQPGYDGVFELKDGGLADNRGAYIIWRLFDKLLEEGKAESQPLLITFDASRLHLRMPRPAADPLSKGWFAELTASYRTTWQTGQNAFDELVETLDETGAFKHVRLQYTAWLDALPDAALEAFPGAGEPARRTPPAAEDQRYLEALCAAEPLLKTPRGLLGAALNLGTHFASLDEREMAAVRVAARFAVWRARDALLDWASGVHGGAPARFATGAVAPGGSTSSAAVVE